MMLFHPKHQSAFSLVEVTLAIGVASYCLIAVFGLLLVGLKTQKESIEQTTANGIFSTVLADLRAAASVGPTDAPTTSTLYKITIPANPVATAFQSTLYFTSDGKCSTTLNPQARYRLTISFQPNGTLPKTATYVNLKISWPAASTAMSDYVQTFAAINRE